MKLNFKQKFFSLLVLTILFCCQNVFSEFDSKYQREFVISISQENPDLNPHTASYSTEAQLINGLYEGLFGYNPITLQPIPALCDSYKLSRDKKTWTFTLKENITFSDGEKITAQTVKNSWIKLLQTKDAPYSSLFDIVQGAVDFRKGLITEEELGIKIKDEKTISVKLINPAEHFPNILCVQAFAIVSEKENVFSGAFVLKEYTDSHIILEKNENFRKKLLTTGRNRAIINTVSIC